MKSLSQGHRLAYLGGEGLAKCTASTSSPVPGRTTILAPKGHTNTTNPWNKEQGLTHQLLNTHHQAFAECLLFQDRKLGMNNSKRFGN